MTSSGTTRQRLRDLKALEGPFDPVDFSAVGDSPQALFLDWLDGAIAAGLAEPHAMTLSTVDAEGHPDARMLILKNVDDRGWHFAISAASPKGRQIEANPAVALTFYWQRLGRQVRIRGRAVALDAAECAQDFLARSVDARANVLLERQSAPLDAASEVVSAIADAKARIAAAPDKVAQVWRAYAVMPEVVEFWQGATDRLHNRLVFRRNEADANWDKELLWP
ncbi:pyridoxine/pyridoxamine 5'-phosphate oxidase [Paracoccus denitrificans]|uniref:pyridoxine/pyridoxamine 5'-phosphate oxidase n=1 Tax=Paracoccus denitrificans TaxID=266 RepID=UPI000CEC8D3A|nr:pyridoxal 5'-phosphate synthase [Paracoccus denitrificans]UFS68419.1 pyridoxal 5'-phosphate synthase [Paracoccus denitrificans]